MLYLLIWINIFYLAYEDYSSAKKDIDHIGYVSVWACLSLAILSFFYQPENLVNALFFLVFWLFNAYVISILEKKDPFELLGAGDYFLFFAVGFFISNPIDFVIFVSFMAFSSFLYVKIRKTDYFPLVPSIMTGFLFQEVYKAFNFF